MTTRKLLVAYDETKPYAGKGDFLTVIFEGAVPHLFGLRSRRIFNHGRMVFIGKEITERELFAKLVDSGRNIDDVEQTLSTIKNYLQKLDGFKIGNIVGICPGNYETGFELVKIAEMPKTEINPLP